MTWMGAFQKAIDYMEAHLTEDIGYADVAKAVHLSGYEFHRSFSFLTGMTPGAYLRSRRLSCAGVELMETDAKVINVALKYGYDSPESFAKAFTRFHGVSPRLAKQNGTKLRLFHPLSIHITLKGGKSMDYRMEIKGAQQFLCVKRPFRNEIIHDEDNHDIPDFWTECSRNGLLDELRALRPEGKRDLYGLCAPQQPDSETFDYGIGILLDEETLPADRTVLQARGCTLWRTEPQQYVVLECLGEDGDCIGEAWERFYKEFLPQTGYKAAQCTDYERYCERGKPGMVCELWIPIEKE